MMNKIEQDFETEDVNLMSSNKEEDEYFALKLMISKKKLFMENVQTFLQRYRTHQFKKDDLLMIGSRGSTISLGFGVVHCLIDSWCPELEIREIRTKYIRESEGLKASSNVSEKIKDYQNNIVVEIILGFRKNPISNDKKSSSSD